MVSESCNASHFPPQNSTAFKNSMSSLLVPVLSTVLSQVTLADRHFGTGFPRAHVARAPECRLHIVTSHFAFSNTKRQTVKVAVIIIYASHRRPPQFVAHNVPFVLIL